MINMIMKLFGIGPSTDFAQLVKTGAIILDVRSKDEFESGHIRGALNIPVDQLRNNFSRLKDKSKPIITCCASGMRSASAKGILKSNGFANVHNGGAWQKLNHKIF